MSNIHSRVSSPRSLLVVMGYPCSGKTTMAKTLMHNETVSGRSAARFNRDGVRQDPLPTP